MGDTNGNIIDAGGVKSEFINFNPSTLTYTVMIKGGAQAIGAGTAVEAPTVDTSAIRARLAILWALTLTRSGQKSVAPIVRATYQFPADPKRSK
jgi:hypothetical protein